MMQTYYIFGKGWSGRFIEGRNEGEIWLYWRSENKYRGSLQTIILPIEQFEEFVDKLDMDYGSLDRLPYDGEEMFPERWDELAREKFENGE